MWWILLPCSHETTETVCLITISRHVDVSFMKDCFRTKWLSHWYALRSCLCGCMDWIIKTRWIPKNLIKASCTSHQRNSRIRINLWDLFWTGVHTHANIWVCKAKHAIQDDYVLAELALCHVLTKVIMFDELITGINNMGLQRSWDPKLPLPCLWKKKVWQLLQQPLQAFFKMDGWMHACMHGLTDVCIIPHFRTMNA